MGTVSGSAFIVTFMLICFVLPVLTACRVLVRHGQQWAACAACAGLSILGGLVGFVLVFLAAAQLLPVGHELIDMERMFGSLVWGTLVGLPLGTWAGAWSVVWFVLRRRRR